MRLATALLPLLSMSCHTNSSRGVVQAQCDVRMLPGQSKDEMERWLRRILRRHALQDVDVSLSLTLENGDLAFPSAGELS